MLTSHGHLRNELVAQPETTPVETIARAVAKADNVVGAEVLERVRERKPAFRERLVLNVLTAWNTGGGRGSRAPGPIRR